MTDHPHPPSRAMTARRRSTRLSGMPVRPMITPPQCTCRASSPSPARPDAVLGLTSPPTARRGDKAAPRGRRCKSLSGPVGCPPRPGLTELKSDAFRRPRATPGARVSVIREKDLPSETAAHEPSDHRQRKTTAIDGLFRPPRATQETTRAGAESSAARVKSVRVHDAQEGTRPERNGAARLPAPMTSESQGFPRFIAQAPRPRTSRRTIPRARVAASSQNGAWREAAASGLRAAPPQGRRPRRDNARATDHRIAAVCRPADETKSALDRVDHRGLPPRADYNLAVPTSSSHRPPASSR